MSENENENRETVADIWKELRRQSDSESKLATQLRKTDDDADFALASCYAEDAKYLSKIADRLEAAWKEESKAIATENAVLPAVCITKRSGNAAAIREALTEIRDTIMNGGFDGRSPAHFVNICDAALSAPDRNCDKYATAEDAYDAYDEITHADIDKYDECRQNCPMCDEKLYIPCGVKWLFAPAAERKGE